MEQISKLNTILSRIDERNNLLINGIKEDKKEFNNKANKIIKFVNSKGKVERIEAGYNLMFKPKEIRGMKKLTKETSDKLYNKALEKTRGNEKKAISLLFDPSAHISL